MEHLVLTRFGQPADAVALRDDAEPSPGPGEVCVRMEAAVVNPSDFLLIRGIYFVRPDLPVPVGGEGVGTVVETGERVDPGLRGSRVIVLPTWSYGTWSEKVVTAQENVLPVPEADPLQLAMLPINPPTAQLLLTRFVDLKPGDWVGQAGANSAVGRYLVALARLRGLKTLNVVRRDRAAEEVRGAGGDVVLVSGPDLAGRIARELDGERLSLVVDPLGGGAASELVGALAFGGTVVSYGSLTGAPTQVSIVDLLLNEVRHIGFWLGNWYRTAPRREIAETLSYLAGLLADGELHMPVEATYALADYRQAFAHAETPQRGGKVLFTFG